MASAASKLSTWRDLWALDGPEPPVPELIEGQIVYKALPKFRHGRAAARVLRSLGPYDDDDRPDGWWLAIEPDVGLGAHTVVRPDLAGWRRSTCPDPPDDEESPIQIRPDWCCEILSKGHEAHDTRIKRRLYLEASVPHYWIVSPMARTLEVFERRESAWVLLGTWGDGDRVSGAPFTEVEIDVGGLFLPPARTAQG